MSSDNSISYVSSQQIEARPAPFRTKGIVLWLQENLFASIRDIILTITFCSLVAYLLWALIPWLFLDSVWAAKSIHECYDAGAGHGGGACFAVLIDRFNQLVFGFYPPEFFWRPILAFFLMLLALAPLLHDNLPRKLLYFSALYPLLCYWMLWGGSLWVVILIIAVIVATIAMFTILSRFINATISLLLSILAFTLWFLFLHSSTLSWFSENLGFLTLTPVESAKFGGFLLTFIVGVTGIAMSLPIGIVLALGRKADNMPIVKVLCVGFIEFIRGVPLITLLFVASTLLNYFLPPGTNFDIILRVLIMVTLFASAYMAEVIRGGLAALPQGQYEASDGLGLTYWQSMRLIVLPQALKISIPGIVNTFIGLFKDTTLVSIIGLLDPIGMMNPIRSTPEWNGIIWEMPIFIGLVFFIFCFAMSRYSMYFERKLDTGHRS